MIDFNDTFNSTPYGQTANFAIVRSVPVLFKVNRIVRANWKPETVDRRHIWPARLFPASFPRHSYSFTVGKFRPLYRIIWFRYFYVWGGVMTSLCNGSFILPLTFLNIHFANTPSTVLCYTYCKVLKYGVYYLFRLFFFTCS